ncbi:MAG: chromosome segregation protein SMC [Paracoccaceae bacterium]
MQLTKIRLLGFKSFVDPTELVIAPGVSGVVGPNGCGKSNLLEALRWAMGENRPTAMRGDGMEDVIFAGAASRPPRSHAEVVISIDNSDRRAPAAFNDRDELEVMRRITRDAGSVFKVNGREARARDVQMLFADASTGAHSPALVRQGQIVELINAKPKTRRRLLEEAAGISGLYQRRHEAELKLRATETNLARVEDVLERLAAQLGQLARQARQAARYRDIARRLRQAEGTLLYRRWREADEQALAAAKALRTAVTAAASAERAATERVRVRGEAEAKVPPLREEEAIAGAVLQRLLVERDSLREQEERARGAISDLRARIAQLTSDRERESGLNRDAGEMIAELGAERAELEKASEGFEDALIAAQDAARAAAADLQEQETALDRLSEEAARLAARHQAAERRYQDAQETAARLQHECAAAKEAEAELGEERRQAEASAAAAVSALGRAQEAAGRAETALQAAEAERAAAQAAESESRAGLSEAEGEAKAIEAEVRALQRLIDRDRGDGGQVLEAVRVDTGYEAALGAALADDLKAPRVAGEAGTGWAALPDYETPAMLPGGVARLSDHVAVPPELKRRLAQIGLVSRDEGIRLQASLLPGQRLVSRRGDLWRWDGYRATAEDAPSSAALRLQQINRLKELQAALGVAARTAQTARDGHDGARSRLDKAQAAERASRDRHRDADARATEAMREQSRAEARLDMLTGKLEALSQTRARREEEARAARDAVGEAERALRELEDLGAARAAVEARKVTVEAARLTMLGKRAIADELRRDGEAREKRRVDVIRQIESWKSRLENAEKRVGELVSRITRSESELTSATSAPDQIAERRTRVAAEIEKAEARRKAASDALAAGEAALRDAEQAERDAERAASDSRETRARAEALAEAAAERVTAAAEHIREEMEADPAELLEMLEADPDAMPSADAIEADVLRLRRQREALGAVNLRAEEDAREVQEEFDGLSAEKADLEAAVRKLRHGIASLNQEGRSRLIAAFEEVNRNFSRLFRHLFGGGDANLVMVESEDPLEAGLEIMCQPPGKKLSTLSLLSGGEQTLTALSLIFAVFLANPSPICVLDEVDAPLDDANVTRFCDLLAEMTRTTDTRFLIITHHAITMSRVDRLFGVTMAEQGVSQLVSVDLQRAEELVES